MFRGLEGRIGVRSHGERNRGAKLTKISPRLYGRQPGPPPSVFRSVADSTEVMQAYRSGYRVPTSETKSSRDSGGLSNRQPGPAAKPRSRKQKTQVQLRIRITLPVSGRTGGERVSTGNEQENGKQGRSNETNIILSTAHRYSHNTQQTNHHA